VSLLLSIGILVPYWLEFGWHRSGDPQAWGLFGDYLSGALGSVLAMTSLFVLVATLLMQREELISTREFNEKQADEIRVLIENQRSQLEALLKNQQQLTAGLLESQRAQIIQSHKAQRWIQYEASLGELDRINLTSTSDRIAAWNQFVEHYRSQVPGKSPAQVAGATAAALMLISAAYPVVKELKHWAECLAAICKNLSSDEKKSDDYMIQLKSRLRGVMPHFAYAFALEKEDQAFYGFLLANQLFVLDIHSQHSGYSHYDDIV
jgi:hypothetical protein